MRPSSLAMITAIGVSCFSLWSCNTEDPSAAKENEKALVEANRKLATLEQEIASLKTENESLRQKASPPESNRENGLTATELDAKLKLAVATFNERMDKIEKKLDTALKPPTTNPPTTNPPTTNPPTTNPPTTNPPTTNPPTTKTTVRTRIGPDGKRVIDGGPFDGQPVGIDTEGNPILNPQGRR